MFDLGKENSVSFVDSSRRAYQWISGNDFAWECRQIIKKEEAPKGSLPTGWVTEGELNLKEYTGPI